MNLGARFIEQACNVQSGSASSDHDYATVLEFLKLTMTRAVRNQFRRQLREILRNILEVSDADRQHDFSGLHGFAVFEAKNEAVLQTIYADNKLVLEFRHHSVAECQAIRCEGVETNRNSGIAVFDPTFSAELPESERALGVIDVGGKTVRLEHHAFRHVRKPTVHRT